MQSNKHIYSLASKEHYDNMSNTQTTNINKQTFPSQKTPTYDERQSFFLPSLESLTNHNNILRSSNVSKSNFISPRDDPNRLRSMKSMDIKSRNQQINDRDKLIEETVNLKTEELFFKIKMRFKSLMLQIGVSSGDLAKFDKLRKIDQILEFLQKRTNQQIIQKEVSVKELIDARYKEKMIVNNQQGNMQALLRRQKLLQIENTTLKLKVKQSSTEIKMLLNQLTSLQRQVNEGKNAEYVLTKESAEKDKVISTLQQRCAFLQENKTMIHIEQANKELQMKLSQLQQENNWFKNSTQKQLQNINMLYIRLNHFEEQNKQLTLDNIRWKERAQNAQNYQTSKRNTNRYESVEETSIQNLEKEQILEKLIESQLRNRQLSQKILSLQKQQQKIQANNCESIQNVIFQWKSLLQSITNGNNSQIEQLQNKCRQLQQQKKQLLSKISSFPQSSSSFQQKKQLLSKISSFPQSSSSFQQKKSAPVKYLSAISPINKKPASIPTQKDGTRTFRSESQFNQHNAVVNPSIQYLREKSG